MTGGAFAAERCRWTGTSVCGPVRCRLWHGHDGEHRWMGRYESSIQKVIDEHATADKQRIAGACLAMARVMVFVWLEAQVQAWMRDWQQPHLDYDADDYRRIVMSHVVESGLMRMEWAR